MARTVNQSAQMWLLQYGSLRIVGLLTWELRAPRVRDSTSE
uniref:Macaca fascicularis brain cDNA clone: QmoA-11973, similar to human ligand of numb-protein X 2 (LNX2), mRNA, RefSeq: NM_153371.2 n=1 Tax=Macaca fascicularis TaxID=9541 RepID=I7GN92_MACFA|nr:unnamed protein product [Macaca fascicularis]